MQWGHRIIMNIIFLCCCTILMIINSSHFYIVVQLLKYNWLQLHSMYARLLRCHHQLWSDNLIYIVSYISIKYSLFRGNLPLCFLSVCCNIINLSNSNTHTNSGGNWSENTSMILCFCTTLLENVLLQVFIFVR